MLFIITLILVVFFAIVSEMTFYYWLSIGILFFLGVCADVWYQKRKVFFLLKEFCRLESSTAAYNEKVAIFKQIKKWVYAQRGYYDLNGDKQ
jgi:hypothetical protein